jgi:hypothetical protein
MVFWGCGFDQPACFYRRSLFFAAGGIDRSLVFPFDYDLFVRLAQRAKFNKLDQFLACLRMHSGTKTATISHIGKMERRILRPRHGWNSVSLVERQLHRVRHRLAFEAYQRLKYVNAMVYDPASLRLSLVDWS